MPRNSFFAALLTFGVFALGCESSSPPPTAPTATLGEPSTPTNSESTDTAKEPEGTTKEPVATAKSEVTLDIKSWDETLAFVAERKGKIVVLDLWSTSCDPCLKEFPHLVELHQKHGGEKLVCMSASCDYIGLKNMPPESYKPQVLEFLTKQAATFPNILLSVEIDALCEKIELASIPAIYVFGRDGKVAKRFDNDAGGAEFTYEKDVVPFVEKLLEE